MFSYWGRGEGGGGREVLGLFLFLFFPLDKKGMTLHRGPHGNV